MNDVRVVNGDITTADVDAIVNAGNTSLWLGSGVAGAIRTKGGPKIQQELEAIAKFMAPAPYHTNLAEVVVSGSGLLPCKYVLHAAVMHSQGMNRGKTNTSIIYMATRNVLLKATELGLGSIALPLFGTGVGGMSFETSASAMMYAINRYGNLKVRIYCWGKEAYEAAVDVLSTRDFHL